MDDYLLYGLFLSYPAPLAWLAYRKRRAEKRLAQTEAALLNAAKMSALGEMAGGIAHEINSPLAVIGMTAEQIEELLQEGAEVETTVQMLKRIKDTVVRIREIVVGLRTFARDDSRSNLQSVPVEKLVYGTLDLCLEKMKQSEVRLKVEPLPENLQARCRSIQVSQVLINLIGNACDAIERLPDKWIRIEAEAWDEYVVIAVTDSGKRISDEIRDKIFQPFFTTKEAGKGTGLGLSISKGIVESQQGSLTLDSTCENTRFVIRLLKG